MDPINEDVMSRWCRIAQGEEPVRELYLTEDKAVVTPADVQQLLLPGKSDASHQAVGRRDDHERLV